jgi:glyoxylase-like metal-dependent hydrolase (beta-lactamase superfamily II)
MEIIPITSRYLFGVNIYLLKTKRRCFLIDTGIAKRRTQLEKKLQEAGCQPGDLELIMITHGHLDHVGNAGYLRDKYGAKIAMHRGDYSMVERGDMFVDTRGGVMIRLVRFLMNILRLNSYEKFAPDMYLEENQDLSTHGLAATIIHVPGHSKGSIGILTADGDLFCGDLLVNTDKPAVNTLIDDSAEMNASVERLRILEIRTVYPGHGKPFQIQQFMESAKAEE